MATEDKCPKCSSENIYQDGNLWICPECSHEWSVFASAGKGAGSLSEAESGIESGAGPEGIPEALIRDAYGNVLADGDTVSVIKDLKVKGSSSVVKAGTKVKGIRLADGGDGHDISCKIDGFGAMNLKSEFVKKI